MVRRTRILLTISNFNTAGSGKVVYDLAKGLDTSLFDVHIACGDSKGSFFKTIESLGLPIHIIETKTTYRPYFGLYQRLKSINQFIKKHQFDIVHSWQWSSDWTEAAASKMAGAKWIYTKKAMGFDSKHWKIKSFLADYIIIINTDMRSYFWFKKSIKLIPLGIDTTYYKPTNSVVHDPLNFKLITVANLVPVKGIEVLLKALKIIDDSRFKLVVLGDCQTEYGKRMQVLSDDLNLSEQVIFKGNLSDVRPEISASDLYVIPTLNSGRKEGMPMALVEAMSMGIPVLGSNISGINYVLKEFEHLLFEAGDEKQLAKKIMDIKAMDVNGRFKLGQELRNYCVSHFTLKTFIDEHENLYNLLTSNVAT